MKQLKLNLPTRTEDTIEIVNINPDFPGIILGLKDNKVVGVIQYDGEYWFLVESIHSESVTTFERELHNLIDLLVNRRICNSFNVIVFGE